MNTIAPPTSIQDQQGPAHLFRRGFLAMLPLWAGAIPFGIAYSVAAREGGMSAFEIQLMSLTVFAAAAQISAVALLGIGASSMEILITAIGLNLHLPLFGAAIARELRLTLPRRLGIAALLTDANYAISAALGPLRTPVLLGGGVSMYIGWNTGTALGLLAGGAIPDPQQYAIDFVVPLTFLAVLIPLVRARPALVVAICSAIATLILASWLPIGVAILLAGFMASMLGVWLTRANESGAENGGES